MLAGFGHMKVRFDPNMVNPDFLQENKDPWRKRAKRGMRICGSSVLSHKESDEPVHDIRDRRLTPTQQLILELYELERSPERILALVRKYNPGEIITFSDIELALKCASDIVGAEAEA